MTFNVDADYEVVRTRLTHNVVGIVEGSDPELKNTYVAYGAHYDHMGYREGAPDAAAAGNPEDRINNGADDDGSGTVAIMAIARAFALGPKPKRSLLFVWHAGEETGLLGSRYNADYPVVPIDKIVARAQHRHDRPQPRRRPEAGQHGTRRRLRSHQHRAAQHQRGRQRLAARSR